VIIFDFFLPLLHFLIKTPNLANIFSETGQLADDWIIVKCGMILLKQQCLKNYWH